MKTLILISLIAISSIATAQNYSESMYFDKSKNELYSYSRLWMLDQFDSISNYIEQCDVITFTGYAENEQKNIVISIKEGNVVVTYLKPKIDLNTRYFNVCSMFELANLVNNK